MLKIIGLVCLFSLALGCNNNNTSTNNQIESGDGEKILLKRGNLSQVQYESNDCQAIISGTQNPQQILVFYKCGWLERSHTMECPSQYNCTGLYLDGLELNAGFSEDF